MSGDAVQSITDGDNHSTYVHGDVYDQYLHIDQLNTNRDDEDQLATDPASGRDPAARSRGYERLDPSDLAALRQPQRLDDYVQLGARVTAASSEETDMTDQNSVSQQLLYSFYMERCQIINRF